jgi:HEPN domain-containing protein
MDDLKKTALTRWLAKASNDLTTARTMLTTNPPVTDTACFHAQQCVEKCLKAFLVFAGIHVERTHYLPRLVELCSGFDPGFQEMRGLAVELTDYAVGDRYPDDWREIPRDEATDAVQKAEWAMRFVRRKLNLADAND